jgi:hypothetical protein
MKLFSAEAIPTRGFDARGATTISGWVVKGIQAGFRDLEEIMLCLGSKSRHNFRP